MFKRLDRVLLTTWLGMMIALWVNFSWLTVDGLPGSTVAVGPRLGLCFAQLAPWVMQWGDLALCPDSPAWTIGALLLQWVLYPLVTQRVINAAALRCGDAGLCSLLALLLAASQGVFFAAAYAASTPDAMDAFTYFFPPAWTTDFAAGAVVAALAARHKQSDEGSPSAAPWLARQAWVAADCAVVALFALAVATPPAEVNIGQGRPSTSSSMPTSLLLAGAWRPHASVPLFLVFFYGSAVGWTPGFFASRLARPVFRSLGAYTLEVYLFHIPLASTFFWLNGQDPLVPNILTPVGIILFLVAVWTLCGSYSVYVLTPATTWMRRHVTAWAEGGGAAAKDSIAAPVGKQLYRPKPSPDEQTPLHSVKVGS